MNNIQLRERLVIPFGIRNIVLALAGVVAALVCGTGTVEEGLEIMFLLPMAFTICSLIFSRAFSYWRDNVAFVIIFASIIIRYLVTPVLMTLSGAALSTVTPTPGYYRLAILIQVFELIVTLVIIDYVWTRHKIKLKTVEKNFSATQVHFKLTWVGVLFLVALVGLVIVRGRLPELMNRYSSWWHISEDFSAIYFYDYISVEIIKSVVGIVLISFFARCYHKTRSNFDKFVYYLLAMATGICMTMFYMYDLRTALAQLVISSMVVILAFFPNRKKMTLTIFGFGGAVLIGLVFASGSMGYEVGGSNDGMLAELSKMAELYVSGPSMVAITQQEYSWVRENMSAMTYLSDIITTTHIFGMFPFLRWIINFVADVPTSNILFVESLGGLTYILPNYSLWTYYATDLLGWLFEILSIYLVIRVICYVDTKKKKVADGCYYYALAYVETLLGQAIFVNNTFLLWHAFTNLPMWLLIFAYINNLGNKIKIK